MDYEAIINFLSSNNNRTDTVSVTITEGESVLEIANTLEKNGALGDRDEFLSLCNSEKFDSDFDFIKAETNADKRYYKLEGYLYPDTYEFYRNENAESVIYKFLNNYETKINEKQTVDGYSKKTTVLKMVEESDTKYSLDQVMTIASIIQAEAADKEDMYYISSILHNRLTADSSLGVSSLGLDSTKFYPYRSLEDVPEMTEAPTRADMIHMTGRDFLTVLSATPVWTQSLPHSIRTARIITSSVMTARDRLITHQHLNSKTQIWSILKAMITNFEKPEILSPAGDMDCLKSALNFGADAVFLAGKMFGMRSAPQNFDNDQLKKLVTLPTQRVQESM